MQLSYNLRNLRQKICSTTQLNLQKRKKETEEDLDLQSAVAALW